MFSLKLNIILRRHFYKSSRLSCTAQKEFVYKDLLNILKARKRAKLKSEEIKAIKPIHDSKISIVHNGCYGHHKSVMINVNDKNYLFNCGENTLRNLLSLSLSSSKETWDIFITRKSWSTIGGLVSVFNNKCNSYRMHAPFNIKRFCEMAYFILLRLTNIKVEAHDHTLKDYEDEYFKIKAVVLKENNPMTTKLDSEEEDTSSQNQDNEFFKSEIENIDDDFKISKENIVYAYVCYFKKSKAKTIVLDCPNENFINLVVNNKEFIGNDIQYLIHLGPTNVLNNPVYKNWIDSNKNIIHLILDESLAGTHENDKQLQQLNRVDPEIYRLNPKVPKNKNIYDEKHIRYCYHGTVAELRYDTVKHLEIFDNKDNNEKIIKAPVETTHKDIYPKIIILGSSSASVNVYRNASSYLVYLNENTSILMDVGEGTLGQIIRHFGENNYRNEVKKIKAIFISHAHGDHQLGLMSVLNERKKIDDNSLLYLCIPDNLKVVLFPQQKLFKEKQVFKNVKIMLTEWFIKEILVDLQAKIKRIEENPRLEYMKLTQPENNKNYREMRGIVESVNNLIKDLDLEIFEAHLLIHMACSCGFYIKLKNQFTLAYTGDCRPSQEFAKLIKNCDLLIHEATYMNQDTRTARASFHSTVGEAINMAKEANAKYLILTHFGNILCYKSSLIFHNETLFKNVGIAIDYMEVNRLNLHKIPSYNYIFQEGIKFVKKI